MQEAPPPQVAAVAPTTPPNFNAAYLDNPPPHILHFRAQWRAGPGAAAGSRHGRRNCGESGAAHEQQLAAARSSGARNRQSAGASCRRARGSSGRRLGPRPDHIHAGEMTRWNRRKQQASRAVAQTDAHRPDGIGIAATHVARDVVSDHHQNDSDGHDTKTRCPVPAVVLECAVDAGCRAASCRAWSRRAIFEIVEARDCGDQTSSTAWSESSR